jgi:hypothetical protein
LAVRQVFRRISLAFGFGKWARIPASQPTISFYLLVLRRSPLRRLQTVSNCPLHGSLLEQSNRRVERGRTQVRVSLRHREALMPDEFLHTAHWGALHRQVRAERMTQDVKPRWYLGSLSGVPNP